MTPFVMWLSSPQRKRAAWSMQLYEITAGASRSRNKVRNSGLAAQAGKALATVNDQSEWGGLDFLASDAFVAEEDVQKREYALKDTKQDKTPGIDPWRINENIREALPLESVVLRAAKVGPGFENEHVAFPARAKLIAHHRPDDPPINSTQVYDPGDGSATDWNAGLHGPVRVRRWVESFCAQRQTVSTPEKETFALLLNGTKSGGDNSGWLAAHFAKAEALLSAEAFGFAHPADDGNHDVGETQDAKIMEGGIEFAVAKFGSTDSGWLYSPMAFNPAQWPFPPKHIFPALVELREDYTDRHGTLCGTAPGRKKWVTWFPLIEPGPPVGPPIRPPEEPPTDDPPGEPPNAPPGIIEVPFAGEPTGRGGVPASSTVPFEGEPTGIVPPTNYGERAAAAMSQIEATSVQYRARPSLPDGVLTRRALGESESDTLAGLLYGYTVEQAMREPVVADDVAAPEYLYTDPVANDNPNQRWPSKVSNIAELSFDAAGGLSGRTPARGPGSVAFMPSNAPVDWQFVENKARWTGTPNAATRIILAGKNAAGIEVAGRFGLGLRTRQSGRIASGQELRLGFDGSGGITEPDLHLYPKTTTGAEGLDTGAAKLVIHEDVHITGDLTVDGSGGGGGVGGSTGSVDNMVLRADGTGGATVQSSGLSLSDVSGNIITAKPSAAATAVRLDIIAGDPTGGGSGGAINIKGGTGVTGAIHAGGNATLQGGNGDTDGSGGNGVVDAGTGGVANGSVSIGATNAESVTIGRSGKTTTISGSVAHGVRTATTADSTASESFGADATKGPWETRYHRALTTAGGGAAETLIDIPTVSDSSGEVFVQLSCVQSTGAQAFSFRGGIAFNNDGGVLTLGTQYALNADDFGAGTTYAVSFVVSGTNVRVRITDNSVVVRCKAIITRFHGDGQT